MAKFNLHKISYTTEESEQYTNITFNFYHLGRSYKVSTKTIFKNWRDPQVYNAIRLSIVSLQKLSYNAYVSKELAEKRSHQEIARLARATAHDLRSPILALKSIYSELQIDDPKLKKVAINSTLRIENIANNLLRSKDSSLTATKDELQITQTDEILDQIIEEKSQEFKDEKRIRIKKSYLYRSSDSFAVINPYIFKNIISNIINNARDAIVDYGLINIDLNTTANNVVIEISDTGQGIPSSVIDKVFNEGFTYGKKNGNGIGLFQAKRTIESWNGKIEIDSSFNQGAIVKITLPKIESNEDTKEKLASTDKTIYIVDNESMMHLIYSDLIKRHFPECEIKSYLSPKLFLEDLEQVDNEALLLSDFDFGEDQMNGIEFIDKLKEISPMKSFIISGHSDEYLKNEFDTKNIDKILRKDKGNYSGLICPSIAILSA